MQEPSRTAPGGLPVGVNLAGYLDATLGVGEAARQVRGALQAPGWPSRRSRLADSAPRSAGRRARPRRGARTRSSSSA